MLFNKPELAQSSSSLLVKYDNCSNLITDLPPKRRKVTKSRKVIHAHVTHLKKSVTFNTQVRVRHFSYKNNADSWVSLKQDCSRLYSQSASPGLSLHIPNDFSPSEYLALTTVTKY